MKTTEELMDYRKSIEETQLLEVLDNYIPTEFTLPELLNMRMRKTDQNPKNGIRVWNMNNEEYEVHQFVNGKIEGKGYRFTNSRLIWECEYKNNFEDGDFIRYIPNIIIAEYEKGLLSGFSYIESHPLMKEETKIKYHL